MDNRTILLVIGVFMAVGAAFIAGAFGNATVDEAARGSAAGGFAIAAGLSFLASSLGRKDEK